MALGRGSYAESNQWMRWRGEVVGWAGQTIEERASLVTLVV